MYVFQHIPLAQRHAYFNTQSKRYLVPLQNFPINNWHEVEFIFEGV